VQLIEKRLRRIFLNDVVLLLDQINNRVVDPRSLKFKRNVHGKPEVSFHLLIQKGTIFFLIIYLWNVFLYFFS
jgi:hypothetical protein